MSCLAYVDPWIAEPGATVGVKVSSDAAHYYSQLLRMGPGVSDERGPKVQHTPVYSPTNGQHRGTSKKTTVGSRIYLPAWSKVISRATLVRYDFWVSSTSHRTTSSRLETIFSDLTPDVDCGLACTIDQRGRVNILVGTTTGASVVATNSFLDSDTWYHGQISVDYSSGSVEVYFTAEVSALDPGNRSTSFAIRVKPGHVLSIGGSSEVCLADQQPVLLHFNGKLDGFSVADLQTDITLLDLDFGFSRIAQPLQDLSASRLAVKTVNEPQRGLPGRTWAPEDLSPKENPISFTAARFCDDDLDDACWDSDFVMEIPHHLSSGAYAFRIDGENGSVAYAVFFVRPTRPTARKICVIMPTFTYLGECSSSWLEASTDIVDKRTPTNDCTMSHEPPISSCHPR